jgi:hypothetical protein
VLIPGHRQGTSRYPARDRHWCRYQGMFSPSSLLFPLTNSTLTVPSVSTSPVHDSCPSSLARKSSICRSRERKLTRSDLLLIKSKLYNLEHGVLTMDKSREFGGTPVVKLGDNFKKVAVSDHSISYAGQES